MAHLASLHIIFVKSNRLAYLHFLSDNLVELFESLVNLFLSVRSSEDCLFQYLPQIRTQLFLHACVHNTRVIKVW